MIALKEKLQRLEGHKLDTLSEVMALEGEQSEEVRETFSDEGAQISKWGKDIEPKEEVEAENQKIKRLTKIPHMKNPEYKN